MLRLKRPDHYTINYPEGREDELLNFYKEILLFEQIQNLVENTFWFTMGDIELHLSPGKTDSKESRHVAFEVDDLEKTRAFFNERNVAIEKNTLKIEGRERLFFRDPFGNRFELIEYLK